MGLSLPCVPRRYLAFYSNGIVRPDYRNIEPENMATATDNMKVGAEGEERRIDDVGEKREMSDSELEATAIDYDGPEARRILSKIDWRLVPVLSLLYLVAFIDRSNSKASLRNRTESRAS
jgi:hypothetical protein